MSRFIEELKSYQNDIDATQIADILWLGKIMGLPIEPPKPTKEHKPEPKIDRVDDEIEETPLEDNSNLPVEVEHEIVISSPKKEQKRRFERQKDNSSIYSAQIEQRERLPNIIKQFSSLQIKQKAIDYSLIDEEETAKYRAVSGILYPFFKEQKIKKSYYRLLIVIDQNSSMFLWQKQIDHFIKSVKLSTLFKSVDIIKLDSTQNYPSFVKDKSNQNLKPNAPIFREKERLTLIFTDVVGKSWRSRYMFEVLDMWSKYSFVSIVSMLPKRMWQKTPLRLGTSLFMRSKKFLPKNSDLKAEFDFIEQSLVKNSTNIPIIPYNDRAFEYLSNILTVKKNAWIDSRVFEGLTTREISDPKEQEIEPSVRVERFFASAPPEARKLAIYCSVLPLNQKVIEEVVKVKALGDDMDAFAEFYFGGLLDRASKDNSFEFEFHKGVRSELIGLISMDEVVSLFEILDGVIADSFGVNQTMLDLLYGGSEDDVLSDREREFALLLVEVLGEKGVFWEGEVERLNQLIDGAKEKIEVILDDKKIDSKAWELYSLAQSIIKKLCNKKCLYIGRVDECIDYINNRLIKNNLSALQKYDKKKGTTIYTYLHILISSRLIDFINSSEGKRETIGELGIYNTYYMPENEIYIEENLEILNGFINKLSKTEQLYLAYYIEGIDSKGGALIFDISRKQYSKKIENIKRKLKRQMEKAGYSHENLF